MIGPGSSAAVTSSPTGNPTLTIAPAVAPVGALAFIVHGELDTDLVTGVTYGGVAMTRQATIADTAGATGGNERGRVYIYALEGSVPAGSRSVVVTRTGTATMWLGVWTLTGNAAMEVLDTDTDAMADTPTVTLARGGRASLAFLLVWASVNSPGTFSTPSGFFRGPDKDFGNHSAAVFRELVTSTAASVHTSPMSPLNNAFAGIVVTEAVVAPPGVTGTDHLCGSECGIVGPDDAASSTGHWHLTGTRPPTSQTSRSRHGGRAYLFTPTDETAYLGRTLPGTETDRWERFYLYFDGVLPSTATQLFRVGLTAGDAPNVAYRATTGELVGRFGTSFVTVTPTGKTVVPNRWYRVDVLVNVVANPNTIKVRVCEATQSDPQADGPSTDLGTASLAQAATTITEFRIGAACWGPTTARVVIDDHLTGTGTGSYPAGPSTIVTGLPVSDGPHSYNAAGDFRTATADLPLNAVDAYTHLAGLLTDVTSYLHAAGAATSEYVEVKLGAVPDMSAIRAMEVVSVHKGETASAHKQSLRWVSGANVENVITDGDFSELTLLQHSKHYTTMPGAVAPTSTLLNASRFRFASSFTAALTGGHLAGLVVEVDGQPVANPPDPPTSDEANPTHVYPAEGTYQVTLTVTDNHGLTHSVTKPVTVFPVTTKIMNVALAGTGTLTPAVKIRQTLVAAMAGSGEITAAFDEGAPDVASTLRVELREGGTLRVLRYLEPPVKVPGESTRYELLVTAEEQATVTDWDDVQLWLVADGGTRAVRVTRFRVIAA